MQCFIKTQTIDRSSLPYLFQKSNTPLHARWRVQKMHLSFCEFKEPVPFYCILPSILKYGYCIRVRSRRIAITMTRWFVIVHEAKFKRKSVTRYFDLLFFLFLFYIFYSFLLFLSLPSTVESKTIRYLECPREHWSSDIDSQVSAWPSSRISFRKDFHGPRPTIRLA